MRSKHAKIQWEEPEYEKTKWGKADNAAFLLRVLLFALSVLPSSIRWKKPIHNLQLFFAAAIWLISLKCTTPEILPTSAQPGVAIVSTGHITRVELTVPWNSEDSLASPKQYKSTKNNYSPIGLGQPKHQSWTICFVPWNTWPPIAAKVTDVNSGTIYQDQWLHLPKQPSEPTDRQPGNVNLTL